jgi:PucR family transcriptional regulator, purine catabolism regulatory protein
MLVQCRGTTPVTAADLSDEEKVLRDKLLFHQIVQEAFCRPGQKILSTTRSDHIVLLIPAEEKSAKTHSMEVIAGALLRRAEEKLLHSQVYVGWGNTFEVLPDGKKSREQAELALKVALTSEKKHYFGYENLGFYKVLFNVANRRELEMFRSEILAPLQAYDQHHHSELVLTLTSFLEDSNNLIGLAEKLHIHRNTLRYRLQKVEEVTGRNLSDTQDRMHLYFATVVEKYLSLF